LIADTDHLDRLASYERALAEQGLKFDPKLVFRIPPSRPDGAQVIRKITSMSHPPTAVYITDPLVAVGALNEAHQVGIRVPEDLSLIGFDDADLRHGTYPRMTAVCQDAVRLGYEVFSTLAAMVRTETKSPPVQIALPTWLEINATTRRVNQEEQQTR
jgi:DNA-binding LacI/PurR family transcriptional regulator